MRFKAMARFNRVVTNRLLGPVARRFAPYAVVHHVGRKTGSEYATPVVAVEFQDGYLIPCPYGAETDWCRNISAAGEFRLERKREHIACKPEINMADADLDDLPRRFARMVRASRTPAYVSALPLR